jgi:uncharacterized protein (DUF1778 family)
LKLNLILVFNNSKSHKWRTIIAKQLEIAMPTTETTRQERMHIRLDALSKQKLEKAASYSHKKLSEFVLSQSLAAAESIISEHEQMTLSQADWEQFLDALENPPAKNAKLKEAMVLHKKSVVRD